MNELSFLIQGKPSKTTPILVQNLYALFPNAIIKAVSTPEFEKDYLTIEGINGYFVSEDVPVISNDENNKYLNKQIINAQNGLSQITTKYCCKIRADMMVNNSYFIKHYFLNKEKSKIGNWIFKDRIMISNTYTIKPDGPLKLPYHPCDWFHLGLTEDLLNLYNVPLQREKDVFNQDRKRRYRSEQYVMMHCLRNNGVDVYIPYDEYESKKTTQETYQLFNDNFVIFDTIVNNGFYCSKYPQNHLPNYSLTYEEWRSL